MCVLHARLNLKLSYKMKRILFSLEFLFFFFCWKIRITDFEGFFFLVVCQIRWIDDSLFICEIFPPQRKNHLSCFWLNFVKWLAWMNRGKNRIIYFVAISHADPFNFSTFHHDIMPFSKRKKKLTFMKKNSHLPLFEVIWYVYALKSKMNANVPITVYLHIYLFTWHTLLYFFNIQ